MAETSRRWRPLRLEGQEGVAGREAALGQEEVSASGRRRRVAAVAVEEEERLGVGQAAAQAADRAEGLAEGLAVGQVAEAEPAGD